MPGLATARRPARCATPCMTSPMAASSSLRPRQRRADDHVAAWPTGHPEIGDDSWTRARTTGDQRQRKLSQVLVIFTPQAAQQVVVVGVTLRDGNVVGADGPDGIDGGSGLTVNGQSGVQANGGCVFANLVGGYPDPSSVFLEQVDVRECEAIGGNGGAGGTGAAGTGLSTGGTGGNGGWGGAAAGGGISCSNATGQQSGPYRRECFQRYRDGWNTLDRRRWRPGFLSRHRRRRRLGRVW